jgi:hypothetical protein
MGQILGQVAKKNSLIQTFPSNVLLFTMTESSLKKEKSGMV